MNFIKTCLLMFVFSTTLYAANETNTLNSGNLSTGSGNSVVAAGNWKSNGGSFKIDWSVFLTDSKTYNYTYSITNKDGGRLSNNLSYILLEVGPSVTEKNYTSLIANLTGGSMTAPTTYTSKDISSLPADIYAIKITTESKSMPVFSFNSSLAPIWGEFYARGSSSSTYAYNTDFADNKGAFKMAIPGATSLATPEPSTYVLLVSLLLAIIYLKRSKVVKN